MLKCVHHLYMKIQRLCFYHENNIHAGDAADVEVILAAVLLPLTVLLISALLFSTCLCFCCRRSKQRYIFMCTFLVVGGQSWPI